MTDQRFSKVFNEKVTNATSSEVSKWFTKKTAWSKFGEDVALEELDALSMSKQMRLLFGVQIVNDFTRVHTNFSDLLDESRRIFMPKMFDRVFNIAVDPDDFEIDVKQTLSSPAGKESFHQLLKDGTIVTLQNQSSIFPVAFAGARYKLRDRNIDENDLVFEKYFITIETVLDTVV